MPRRVQLTRVLLLVVVASASAATAIAQTPAAVRVVNPASPILRWHPRVPSDVLTTVGPNTTLEVLDQERGWYWVIAPRDAYGTRRPGWISARNVEIVPAHPVTRLREPSPRVEPSAGAPSPRVDRQAPATVVITEGPSPAAASSPARGTVPTTLKQYEFEDVHFDRNQSALKLEATLILDGAANAMSTDPVLRLTIEGHTCSLGTSAYNLALGDRRATAVRDYLMSRGVPADRLRTVSYGEDRPKHDNSEEETRRLNRRVTLVANAP